MKRDKTIYWVSTVLAMLLGATSAFFYFTNSYMIEGFKHVGFPSYFRIELGIAKISGILILLIPKIPKMLKEWAYVGFGITFISGTIAHGVVDGLPKGLAPVLPLIFLIVSYYYFRKLNYQNLTLKEQL
ncbi:DoxX family protein [Mucilaginibacter sp. FT3.2]|uniref:DoxX family protein n=1 Tax=Mucilaginibacter sp. FT3.2 TaxID=2723090 RepID=UPI0016102571|nr:DoxX family protein [Mucilaginibacter sp. FT3.2]MBB6232497.1 hypothetical protein [Mucilaginibacter sp. FT3.2]